MTSLPTTSFVGVFARRFRREYLRSLRDHRFFYDDVAEIGNATEARHAFYFVPGINGTPGQMRFLMPAIARVFGSRIYMKALHLPEFSAHVPTWEKYTTANVDRKLAQLRADLADMLARFDRFAVLCSSNGLYDFLAAADAFPAAVLESRIELAWGACAPDRIEPSSPWEKIFSPLNGFVHEGHRWFAYPNHNAFTVLNPETSTTFAWADSSPRALHKVDLESRFRCGGLQWDYVSPSQLSAAVQHVVAQIRRPWRAPSEAVVAANDGYWQGASRPDVEATVRRYLPRVHCEFKPNSHLWVVNPSNITELFTRMRPRLAPLATTRTWTPPDGGPTAVSSRQARAMAGVCATEAAFFNL